MSDAFSSAARLRAMLDVEVAFADAAAVAGVIPAASAVAVRDAATADPPVADIETQALAAGNLAIPLVEWLTARVAASAPEAADHVHYGLTSQDVLDTALVLQVRRAARELDATLDHAAAHTARLARLHASTPMAGRTWLQHATPTTFGLKSAGWLDALERARLRLGASVAEASVVQVGGASGTLAALGEAGPDVADALAAGLGLLAPVIPWHTARDRVAGVACALGIACGTIAKIAGDIVLLAQSEVGEVTESATGGRGRSSSMPHKRNPVAAVRALAAAAQTPGLVATMLAAMPQAHERAAGGWQAEWDTMPALMARTIAAATALAESLEGLDVHVDRVRANLGRDGGVASAEGLVTLLAPLVGRLDAQRLAKGAADRAGASGMSLAEAAAGSPDIVAVTDATAIARALDPQTLTATCPRLVEAVLTTWRR